MNTKHTRMTSELQADDTTTHYYTVADRRRQASSGQRTALETTRALVEARLLSVTTGGAWISVI